MTNKSELTILVALVCLAGSPVQAQWKTLKKFIQKGVTVEHETKEMLVIIHDASQGKIVIGLSGDSNCDIYASMDQKRGGNPYRIWVSTDRLWKDPKRPRKTWGKFFTSGFLKLLRPPEQNKKAKQDPVQLVEQGKKK